MVNDSKADELSSKIAEEIRQIESLKKNQEQLDKKTKTQTELLQLNQKKIADLQQALQNAEQLNDELSAWIKPHPTFDPKYNKSHRESTLNRHTELSDPAITEESEQ